MLQYYYGIKIENWDMKKIAIKRENFHISVEERKLSKIFSEGGFDLKNRAAAAGFLKKQTDSR